MFISSGDPVTDAERYQQYLEETYPVKDGVVNIKLDLCIRVEGRSEEDWLDEARQVLRRMMGDPSVWEWDVLSEEAEEY